MLCNHILGYCTVLVQIKLSSYAFTFRKRLIMTKIVTISIRVSLARKRRDWGGGWAMAPWLPVPPSMLYQQTKGIVK